MFGVLPVRLRFSPQPRVARYGFFHSFHAV